MESIKVEVNNEAESKEVQGYFEELGFKKVVWGLFTHNNYFIFSNADYYSRDSFINFSECDYKEITPPQLRDMVVLRRNSIDDATHGNTMYPYVKLSDGWYYFDKGESNKWLKSVGGKPSYYKNLKPIEKKEMKEFLVKQGDKWALRLLDSDTEENSYRVAVPSGATHYSEGKYSSSCIFLKVDGVNQYEYYNDVWLSRRHPLNEIYLTTQLLWQRSETESLNDQYAEIEKVRQDMVKVTIDELKHRVNDKVNNPSHYSDSTIECIDAMEAMMTPEQFIGYLRGNVAKYLWRYDKKNGIEDLQKSEWYLKKLIEKEIKNEDQGGDCVSIDW